jgi:hypothetical protein
VTGEPAVRLAALLSLLLAVAASAQENRTLKERLSDKASDEQRVDNCHVPADRRGPVPRPDCPAPPSASARATRSPAAVEPR